MGSFIREIKRGGHGTHHSHQLKQPAGCFQSSKFLLHPHLQECFVPPPTTLLWSSPQPHWLPSSSLSCKAALLSVSSPISKYLLFYQQNWTILLRSQEPSCASQPCTMRSFPFAYPKDLSNYLFWCLPQDFCESTFSPSSYNYFYYQAF